MCIVLNSHLKATSALWGDKQLSDGYKKFLPNTKALTEKLSRELAIKITLICTFHVCYIWMLPVFKKAGPKNCMWLQIKTGPWLECSFCLALERLQTAGLGSWQSFVSGQRGVNLCCLEQCIKVVQPSLIRSIRGCVSGVLSHTQHGPCFCSSAVVLGGEGFSVGGCSCALSLLSETREDWPCWPINRLHRHTVSSIQPLETSCKLPPSANIFERSLARRRRANLAGI